MDHDLVLFRNENYFRQITLNKESANHDLLRFFVNVTWLFLKPVSGYMHNFMFDKFENTLENLCITYLPYPFYLS